MADSVHIAGVTGKQFSIDQAGYHDANQQYATSSEGKAHDMNPGLIVQPNPQDGIHDIVQTLKYAKEAKKAVAIRTGGHQYSGASSTGPSNILLDLQHTFKNPEDRQFFPADQQKKTHFRTSVSWNLDDFNAYLGSQKPYGYFVPHGQCYFVNLGGHVQTGGYGQLGRSFGLLGDFVTELELVDPDTDTPDHKRYVNRKSDPELFYAVLGGSPGNFGVLTHFTIRLNCDSDYEGSYGQKTAWYFEQKKFEHILGALTKMSDSGDLPRNYDFCVSVVSASWKAMTLWKDLEDRLSDDFDKDGTRPKHEKIKYWFPLIVIYAQYVPFDGTPPIDMKKFEQFSSLWEGGFDIPIDNQKMHEPMSKLYRNWLTPSHREFDHPYIKRTYLTKSTSLSTNGWVKAISDHVHDIIKSKGCYTSCQFQYFGGKNSQFTQNANNGTAYSWRDSTMCATMDAFHETDPSSIEFAKQWQVKNDIINLGDETHPPLFSDQDRRVLWGSYSRGDEWSLDADKDFYYEPGEDMERTKYKRLQATRAKVDPHGIYTPNPFCVQSADIR